ncbi:MAG: HAMP domain-containing histidine kinase [Hyphomicrobiales bacterium]|nr:HAMP domain-containing histidine kinase [Hyphomicrobiales bacterium]
MWTNNVVRERAFRLALAFALTIAAATAGVFFLIYLAISDANVKRLSRLLEAEVAAGVEDGDERLRQELDLRVTRDLRRVDYVAVFDAKGSLVFGNVATMPPLPLDGHAHEIDKTLLPDSRTRDAAIFVARRRPDGSILLLGRSLAEINELAKSVLRVLALAIAPTILLILAIGAFFARRAARRIANIHAAITHFMGGDFGERLPVAAEGDDIDRVARDVNLMLDEIANLLDQLKSVGDNIAHDLRTPLAVARAKIERGLARDKTADDLRATMADALDHLDKAAATIAALLRISALENNVAREARFTEVDLAAVCASVFEFYEPLAQSKAIAMTCEAAGPLVLRGDEELMREALSNLVDNAIKFTPEGGAVRIAAAMEGGSPYVSVSDSGCGVSPDQKAKIFRRFYRIERGGLSSGHGIGLSIAETIARLHGFQLSVADNAPGARFEMRRAAGAATKLGAPVGL